MTDQALLFGPARSLVGILSRPQVGSRPQAGSAPAQPAIVILNTGIIHRIGHNRMYVTLARLLAQDGFAALRFDLSGIGDSAPREDALAPREGAIADIRAAIDWLQANLAVEQVILLGLCDGADTAVFYAATDKRVVGLVLLEASVPPTPAFYANYVLRSLLQWGNWAAFLRGHGAIWRMLRKRMGRDAAPGWEDAQIAWADPAVTARFRAVYARALENGVRFLSVMTSGVDGRRANQHIVQFSPERFKGDCADRLTERYMTGCDHTFSTQNDRARLFATIRDWLAATPWTVQADPKLGAGAKNGSSG